MGIYTEMWTSGERMFEINYIELYDKIICYIEDNFIRIIIHNGWNSPIRSIQTVGPQKIVKKQNHKWKSITREYDAFIEPGSQFLRIKT